MPIKQKNKLQLLTLAWAGVLSLFPRFSAGETAALDPVIVTGLRLERSVGTLAQPVTVVGMEQLERHQDQSLGEILEGRAGSQILVKGNGFAYGKSGVSLRSWGMGSEIVVALNGRRISNDTDGEGFDLSLIDPAVLNQVEVLRGALSSVYGNGAHAGVVHLSALAAGANEGVSVRAGGGSDGYHRESFRSGWSGEQWGLTLAGSNRVQGDRRTPDHGVFKNTGSQQSSFFGEASRALGSNHRLTFTGLFGRGWNNGLPGDLILPAPYDRDELDDRGYGRIEMEGVGQARWSLLVDSTIKSRRNWRLGPAGSTTVIGQNQQSRTLGGQATWQRAWGSNELLFGGEIGQEWHRGSGEISLGSGAKFPSPKLPPSQVQTAAVFGQDEWDLPGRWALSLGARLEWQGRKLSDDPDVIFGAEEGSDSSATGHVGIVKRWGNFGIRSAAGTSYVAPNIIQLYTFNPRTGFALLGNPGLAPERGYSVDAGIFGAWQGFDFDVTFFTSDMWDRLEMGLLLRDFGGGGTQFLDLDGAFHRPDLLDDPRLVAAPTDKWFYHKNLGQVRMQGLEAGMGLRGSNWWLRASVSGMTLLRELKSGQWLPELPPVSGRISAGYAGSGGAFSVNARGSSGYDSISRTRPGRPRVWVPGYILVGANFSMVLTENLSFFAAGDNLLDQPWQSTLDVPGPGISGRAGLELTL